MSILNSNCRYIVLNRPYAFVQWVKKAKIAEKYVLMAEPDHVMIRPIPNFMTSEAPGLCRITDWHRLSMLAGYATDIPEVMFQSCRAPQDRVMLICSLPPTM
jgi:hypothetical protein